MEDQSIENQVQITGLKIFESSKRRQTVFKSGGFSELLMSWAMDRPDLKIELFRFVDVLPTLVSDEQVSNHLREYFLGSNKKVPLWMRSGLSLSLSNPVSDRLAVFAVKKNVSAMARSFITGNNSQEAQKKLRKIWQDGFCFTVDILGEAIVSKKEALDYQARYMELVEGLSRQSKKWPVKSILESTSLSELPRSNVSVKLSSLYSQISTLAFRDSVNAIKDRLRPILKSAVKNHVFINIDMEQDSYKDLVLTVFEEILLEEPFITYPHFGVVIQAYLKSAKKDLQRVIDYSGKRKCPVTVRLVKGAYWDYENIIASQQDWDVPVYPHKHLTDVQYEACLDQLLEAYPKVLGAIASHNVRSLSYAMTRANELGIPKSDLEIQMLFGMSGGFGMAVRDMGYRVRLYAPVGELLPGMAYLVRRLLENTSNEGFLQQSQSKGSDQSVLLESPKDHKAVSAVLPIGKETNFRKRCLMFKNEAMLDFSKVENREWMDSSLKTVRQTLPVTVPVVIGGVVKTELESMDVINPSFKGEVVAKMDVATESMVDEAMKVCDKGRESWAKAKVSDRSQVLKNAADAMLKGRQKLMTLMVLESGKTWDEADADVCEAIDFCRYYADLAEELMNPQEMGGVLGETNEFLYQARGTCVAIAPWNFPLAILCGMTVAPLVCGNPVVMKPAEQSPAIAYELYKILIAAGVPAVVLQFMPGKGEVVGAGLVKHKSMHVISFTGSREVGLFILKEAAGILPGQRHIKKVVAEMGGKNATIIDDDADLDEAVLGCLSSAFGFAGQKCSALSRIIVLEKVYDKFKERFVEALLSLKVGSSEDVATKVGPVVDGEAQFRLLELLALHKDHIVGQLELPEDLKGQGFYVAPTIFESDDPQSALGQQEFFGPVVTLFKVKDINTAIKVLNDVDYALTGGIFSRSPAHIDMVREQAEVGNLYINRSITGALVCRQPFGGFKLSGVGGKAGGPDYLLHFLEPRTITENTMRSGFAPGVGS